VPLPSYRLAARPGGAPAIDGAGPHGRLVRPCGPAGERRAPVTRPRGPAWRGQLDVLGNNARHMKRSRNAAPRRGTDPFAGSPAGLLEVT
jgi:hypothetical protein